MPLPLKLQKSGQISLQTQIFEQMRGMILEGRLRPGEPVPATRALSEQLGIARNTIALAYERLIAEGYIETRRSVGTFISMQIPEGALYAATHRSVVPARGTRRAKTKTESPGIRSQALVNPHRRRFVADFWVGRPDPNSFPRKTWAKLISRRLLSAGSALTEYRDPSGFIELRRAIADRVRPTRNIATDADEIIIVGGCQDGLNLVSRMMLSPGSTAVVESPCYQGAAFLFESFGANIFPVRVDERGLDCRQLPNAKNAIAYVTPSHQYPLGVTLSLERRLELLAWAAETNSYILEDDYDSDFRFHGAPIAALKGLDRTGRVIYLGTFSKCLGAGLRLGYVIFPPELVDRARHMKTLMNNGQPWLEQATLADFMESGGYERHVRRIRKLYFSRRNALLAALEKHFSGGEIIGDEAGMHLAWRLPRHLPSASKVEKLAIEAGVGVYTLASGAAVNFDASAESERYLVLGFSSLTEREIATGIARLADVL
ncbi:PLP-dependent aminotransferase family protein [Hyphomicrobium sp.]|uniref:MocR-like pyridoxine biosynthesis transcription factor PdxR n=1 Tax=Hyphomicrobium sp. TaxID=82 RepID=UPI002E368F06|nr:PLP-dependent aminotransferase family protein [Hyphomicrobium sp.]HEX2842292.1 PLP-dependent aminotransferase family protein [Hyphomicrobium sp.]